MTDFDRCYKLTVIRAPEVVDVKGFDASFFEQFETITEIVDQRIQFKVEKHLRSTPNQAEIIITNLAEASRSSFADGPVKVRLEAGYDNDPRLLFLGDVRYGPSTHEGTEWLTKLQVADGGRAFAHARVNRTYAKGTPLTTVIKDLAAGFGVPLPTELSGSAGLRGALATSEVITGYASDELTRILDPFGFGWSFQNGRLQLLRTDAVVPGVIRIIEAPPEGGMIGSPVIDPPKITAPRKASARGKGAAVKVPKLKVKHTLYPELIPGETIEVRSRSIHGTFRIESLVHEGDNHGSDWTTTIEGTAV